MKETGTGPAVQNAIAFVKENLARGEWRPGDRLPPTRRLAMRAGVSCFTMIKAVALLKAQGVVSGVERGHLRAGNGADGALQKRDVEIAAWELKRTALEQDLLAGKYEKQGKLPSFKELQTRYGTCYRTMRKILRSMVADGVVRMRGRTHELERIPRRHFSPRVVFITFHHVRLIPRSALNPGHYRVLDLLENECGQRDYILELVEIASYTSQEIHRVAYDTSVTAAALGYVIDLWWYPNEDFRRSHFDLLSRLSALKRPVAILDEVGDFELPRQFSANPLIQVFRCESRKAGSRIARLLIGMGHRSAAFISSYHDASWSRQRFDGALEQYRKAGCGEGVQAIVQNASVIGRESVLAVSGIGEALIRKILGAGQMSADTDELFRAYLQFKKSFSAEGFTRDDIRVIRERLRVISDTAARNPDKELFDRICFEVFSNIVKHFTAKVFFPLFDRALACRNATAWICANDGVALAALSFLRGRAIAVPQQLSIAGFDNEPVEALENRLTTFDFNALGFVHRILNFIARPPKPRGSYQHTPIEVEGIVVVRGTTAIIEQKSFPKR